MVSSPLTGPATGRKGSGKGLGASERKPPAAARRFERQLQLLLLLMALPGFLVCCILLGVNKASESQWLWVLGFLVVACFLIAVKLVDVTVRPLQTLANVVGALREEDFSFRARGALQDDAMGELAREVNLLASALQQQKLSAIEATALLRRVVESIDAPLFAFDSNEVLRLVNPAAERLMARPAESLLGRSASEIGLLPLLSIAPDGVVTLPLSGRQTKWIVRRSTFRQRGTPHTLLLLSNVSTALREEERQAWQRLMRVLGHEVNNSLAPIKSIAGSLRSRIVRDPEPTPDFARGLAVIEERAEALNRFLQSYRQLAQLPPPSCKPVELVPLLERLTTLETRVAIRLQGGKDALLFIDCDQVEQMLINLVKNAVEAAMEGEREYGGTPDVSICWAVESAEACISIVDNGPGLMNPSNIFVPFYTTKEGGTGIGLVLARQIAEAHSGNLRLQNRTNARGCEVQVRLPLAAGHQ